MSFYIIRQPILDRDQRIVAFSINYPESETVSTFQSLQNALDKIFDIGMDTLLASTKGFLTIDSTVFKDRITDTIPPSGFCLILDADPYILRRLMGPLKELNELSYELTLSVSNYSYFDECEAYLHYFTYVKLNAKFLQKEEIEKIIERIKLHRPKVLITNISTQELFAFFKEKGADLFQGNYLAKSFITKDNKIPPEYKVVIDLLNLLDSDQPMSKISHYFSSYPKLTLSLLQFLNSASFFLKVHVKSIDHAILLLGRKQMRRWLLLTAFSKASGNADIFVNPLLTLAQSRSSLMEALALLINEDQHQAAFIGSLSLLEALTQVPIEKILTDLSLDEYIRKAILEFEGTLGTLLELVLSTEQSQYEKIETCLHALKIDSQDFQKALAKSYEKKNFLPNRQEK